MIVNQLGTFKGGCGREAIYILPTLMIPYSSPVGQSLCFMIYCNKAILLCVKLVNAKSPSKRRICESRYDY